MTLLKEFALSLPGTDKERRRQFQLQTRCITSFYERLFPRFKTTNCWKVLLECVDTVTAEKYRDLSGVYVLEVQADVNGFFVLSDSQKKQWTLNVLWAGIDRLLQQTGWQIKPFSETFAAINALHLVNRWVWRKLIPSPSRKLVAQALIEHDVQTCDISIVVHDRSGQEVQRKLLISEQPDEWAYARHLGDLTWESETHVVLRNKARDTTWSLQM